MYLGRGGDMHSNKEIVGWLGERRKTVCGCVQHMVAVVVVVVVVVVEG